MGLTHRRGDPRDRSPRAGRLRPSRTADPADCRRVVVGVVAERASGRVESLLGIARTGVCQRRVGRYSAEQLALINDFLSRMADPDSRPKPRACAPRPRVIPSEPHRSIGALGSPGRYGGGQADVPLRAQDLRLRADRVPPRPSACSRARFDARRPRRFAFGTAGSLVRASGGSRSTGASVPRRSG